MERDAVALVSMKRNVLWLYMHHAGCPSGVMGVVVSRRRVGVIAGYQEYL